VIGAGHFRTSVWKGLEIMEGLRGHISGLAIPTYVVDSPHGGGKIPLMPNYLVSASDDAVVLRNFEGMLVRYQAEDKVSSVKPTPTRGVSSLLQGSRSALVPENNERMARRRLRLHMSSQSHNQYPDDTNSCSFVEQPEYETARE
jgi:lysine 2,3-aminomutase